MGTGQRAISVKGRRTNIPLYITALPISTTLIKVRLRQKGGIEEF
jgi:hypothetical protein